MRFLFGLLAASALHAAQLDVLEIPGVTLRDNPLGDLPTRRLAVFTPDQTKNEAPLPMVIYLPGWGGSSEDAIAQGRGAWFGRVVDEMAGRKLPVRIAVVDGRSRYGGSQFLNSTATGRYADYVADEIAPTLDTRYALLPGQRFLAGHSSGAYGALLLTMNRHALFAAVVALSPDSDFEETHKPLVQQPSVRAVTPADLDAAMAPAGRSRMPGDGLAQLVMGLCANYGPSPDSRAALPGSTTTAANGAPRRGSAGSISTRSRSSGKMPTLSRPLSASISTARNTTNSAPTSALAKFTERFSRENRPSRSTNPPATTATGCQSGSCAGSFGFRKSARAG